MLNGNDLVGKSLCSSEDWERIVRVKFIVLCRTAGNSSDVFGVNLAQLWEHQNSPRKAAITAIAY